jgi:MFS family permease
MKNNKLLASIFLIVFIDLLGFSLILPLLPYYAKTFNANGIVSGLLVASYAAFQLLGAPLLGRLSDRYGRRPNLLIISRFFFGLVFSIFQTIFSLYALTRFNLTASQTSYILVYVGVLSVITQGFLMGRLTNRIRDDILIVTSVVVMAACLFAWAFAPSVALLLVILAPTALSGGMLNTVLSSTLTKAVAPQEIGGILGLSASIDSLTRVFAPALGGVLLTSLGTWAPGLFGALVLAFLTMYLSSTILSGPSITFRKDRVLAPQSIRADE